MPSKSKKQATAMRIAAAGKGTLGIPQKVAREFVAADKQTSRSKSFKGKGKRKS